MATRIKVTQVYWGTNSGRHWTTVPVFKDNETDIPQLIEERLIKYTLTYSSIIVPPNEEKSGHNN